MHAAHEFLQALAIVLCVAAVITVVFHRLHQPVVLGYVLAGLIVGPHVPIPLVADVGIVQTLSELGVILLMFSLGLDFSLRKLIRVGPTAGLTALLETSLMFWIGMVAARALGWSTRESLFTGAIVAISSTTIIAKVFEEQKIRGRLRELVVGVLIVEDLIAILLMAALTSLSAGRGLSAGELALNTGRLVAFLIALVVFGMLVVPRMVRAIAGLGRPETLTVSSIGICFAFALLAQSFGYSVALGAFIAGSLVAESGVQRQVEHLVSPVRDVFAAIFFVSVGMLIDPRLILEHWVAVLVLSAAVVGGKMLGVSLGGFLTGNGVRTSVQASLSLAQIGEFSFIIAGLGVALKATGNFLFAVAVAVSALTTLATPALIRRSGLVANWVDRKLPGPVQTFAALYGSWIERLGQTRSEQGERSAVRRWLRLLLADALVLAGILIGAAIERRRLAGKLEELLELDLEVATALVTATAVLLALPFAFGMVRLARQLGGAWAARALPLSPRIGPDLAAAPRRALVVTTQLAVVMIVGAPLIALSQTFLPGYLTGGLFVALLGLLAVSFWRSAANLHGHVRASTQAIVEILSSSAKSEQAHAAAMDQVRTLLPGLGEPEAIELRPGSAATGKTLSELNFRGVTGATVLAIVRGNEGVVVPSADDALRPGDVLAVAGSHAAIEAARALIAVPPPQVLAPAS